MQKIRYIFGILIACMLILSHAQKVLQTRPYKMHLIHIELLTICKRIVFTKVQCAIKSNKVVNVGCFLEENSAFTFQSTVGNKDVGNLVGIMELNLSAEGQRKVTRINGVRLDICKMLDAGIRPSMLSFIFQGIQQTDNNMPRRCPFKRVSRGHEQGRIPKADVTNFSVCRTSPIYCNTWSSMPTPCRSICPSTISHSLANSMATMRIFSIYVSVAAFVIAIKIALETKLTAQLWINLCF